MQVNAAVIPQHAAHFHQADAHKAQKRRHIIAVNLLGGGYDAPDFRVIALDFDKPAIVQIIPPRPAVLKRRARRQRVGRSVKVAAFVKRRVGGDEMHRAAVHTPQEIQIVAVVQRPAGEIRLSHNLNP